MDCKYPHLKASTSHGYGCHCNRCKTWHNQRAKRYRDEHPEKSKTYQKNWINQNREHRRELSRKWSKNNPDKVKDMQLKIKFGITLTEYNQLLIKQNNQCAICKRYQYEFKRLFPVDHDHKTGKIRGLLCHECNVGLGYFKDSLESLDSATNYLIQFSTIGC